jgi:AcrR family transcriptional regulator
MPRAQPTIRQKSAKPDARQHILEVATRLFAERGLDAVSVRDITGAAKLNVGAVNYHFGSKESLIIEIFEMLLTPLQQRRLARLDQLDAVAGDRALDMEAVLRAFIEPTVKQSIGQTGLVKYLPRLMFQAYSVSRPFLNDRLSEQSDQDARRFIAAFARAAPGVSSAEMSLRYFLLIGGILQMTQSFARMRRLSGGDLNPADSGRLIDELTAFYLRAMTAPEPAQPAIQEVKTAKA